MRKSTNLALLSWVGVVAEQTQPESVHWWQGTQSERDAATQAMHRLRQGQPDADVERVAVAISTPRRVDAGPTNAWISPDEAQTQVWSMFKGSMKHRTMYVVPYVLGTPPSPFCKVGVQITDSPHVALSIDATARAGRAALHHLGGALDIMRGLHSVGSQGPAKRLIVHFPETVETWSFGSEALSNAVLSRGTEGLRLASSQAREEGWLAEHMTLFELTGDGASRVYFAAAGADTEALDQLRAAGTASGPFELRQLGGETCWMRPSADGRLRAIDPENRDWQPSHGVPLSALIFCGRQARSTPLVYEARSWRQGVYVAATLMREASGTSWATHDPMAMLSRCGYNMGDYFAHWLSIGRKLQEAPKFFHINWFRSDGAGPLWPGGAENIRVLRWIAGRLDETQGGRESPVGITPEADSLDRNGLAMSSERLEHALSCNHGALLIQAEAARRYLAKFGDTLPPPLLMEHRHLVRRLQESLH